MNWKIYFTELKIHDSGGEKNALILHAAELFFCVQKEKTHLWEGAWNLFLTSHL